MVSDRDYDVSFVRNMIINGKVRVNFSQGAHKTAGTTTTSVLVRLIHYDGSTETVIDSATSVTTSNGGANNDLAENVLLELDTGGRVNFKIGDILRINLTRTEVVVVPAVL